jgi:hypothetical protein
LIAGPLAGTLGTRFGRVLPLRARSCGRSAPLPLERGFTIAFAISACGALVALAPTLLLGRVRVRT